MAGPIHTYGPTCLLSDGDSDPTALRFSLTPPKLRAQFFYVSSLPIDDPLSPLPPPSGGRYEIEKIPPQPFSAKDNAALEEAWQALREPRRSRPSTSGSSRKRERSPMNLDSKSVRRRTSPPTETEDVRFQAEDAMDFGSIRGQRSRNVSINGSPFARSSVDQVRSPFGHSVESGSSMSGQGGSRPQSSAAGASAGAGAGAGHFGSRQSGLKTNLSQQVGSTESLPASSEENGGQTVIPVGVSRLHLVELPNLNMKPIYWSPLHDISNVLRSTWFYKNTMLPVDTELANKLEEGYVYFKPWTETWQDELNSCVENGADAEMKIVHRLWPEDGNDSASRPATSHDKKAAASQSDGSAVETVYDSLVPEENRAAGLTTSAVKTFLNSSAIYVDAENAQILRPSLLPSISRGRRPLSAIRKGRQIGIPVVRGFSRKSWGQLHPSRPNPIDVRHYLRRTQYQTPPRAHGQEICYACEIEESRPKPTELVLVIHGIGQKLSERMESFHFTHSINALRRHVNEELNNEPVWSHVRPDHGGIMVLPVNWRSTLSLEDGCFEDTTANNFSLKDIVPETMPGVRSLISDVMLDIPYYLSHHKTKMVQAVAKEANRVYRLWCKNNPGFHEYGNVHLIAHSLGSVMALDILSHQPTKVPRFNFSETNVHSDIFEFDTKNLFLCGSPAGFFLLLNKANLIPRRGVNKPGSNGDDRHPGLAGEADTYGCLGVHNVYNIMHTTDPITYRVNAAVDRDLAESLKMASVPSSSATLWQSFSSIFRWGSSSTPTTTPGFEPATSRPVTLPPKLPANVELETHDFTREEIAEKRMFLLNDNGQIDYYLSGGGGPLNIQYLNMLSAHSSYWILTDFVRFFVVEIARKQGREGTLPAFRAEKKKGLRRS